jgi:hypothetical protein
MSPGTIFFVHRGVLPAYAQAAILQAKKSNHDCSIVVLGDQTKSAVPSEVQRVADYVSIEDFQESAFKFAQIYRHDGRNSLDYELGNFQRWFVVDHYCQSQLIPGPLLVLDSDAYVYLDTTRVVAEMRTDMTVVNKVGPQFTYFRNSDTLSMFTQFLTKSFADAPGLQRLKDFVHTSDDAGLPHVSDMAAFGVFALENRLDDVGIAGDRSFVFCENVGLSQGLRMNALGKRVVKRYGSRHFITHDGRHVLAGGVHLQGGNKVLWPFFVDQSVRRAVQRISPLEYRVEIRAAILKALMVSLLRVTSMLRRKLSSVLTDSGVEKEK